MRKISKTVAALTAGCMLLSTSAFAAVSDNINETAQLTGGAYQVDLTYDTKSGQSTILVVKEGTDLAKANEDNILYINQDAINTETGAVSYNVNLGANFIGNADVWVGGTNEGTATKIGTLSGVKPVVGPESVTIQADVVGEDGETIERTDVTEAAVMVKGELQLYANIVGETTESVVWSSSDPTVATVADGIVTGVSFMTDEEIVKNTVTITATVGDKSASVVVTTYLPGDIDGDGYVTASDAIEVENYAFWYPSVLDTADLNGPVVKASDIDNDGYVTASDAIEITNYAFWYPSILDSYYFAE